MSFAHPWALVFLLVPAALLARVWRTGDGRLVLPLDHHPGHGGRWLRVLIDTAESLLPLAAAVGIVIAAGPTRTGTPRTRRVLSNIEFCVDVSGSMGVPYADGTRYDASMAAIDQFLGMRAGDAFGLTFFGSSVLHWAPLTTDTSALRCAMPFMHPDRVPPWFGGTEIGRALLAAATVLDARPEGDRAIILVSDGMSSDLDGDGPARVIRTLTEKRIVLWTIHVGGGPIPAEVVDIAAATGGGAFAADDPGMLREVFTRIDQLQPTRLATTAAEPVDAFAPWSAAGLAALALATLASLGLRYTPW